MKKYFFLFLLTICFANSEAQTSIYHPFPDSNAVWNVTLHWLFNCGTLNESSIFSYTFSGDTTINSKKYHKVIIPYVQHLDTCHFPDSTIIKAGYQGCIRQDTVARKVYVIWPNDTTQRILYDFSLQVGDKYNPVGLINCYYGPTDSIISIDSVLIGSEYRKRWNGWNAYVPFIEGVGYDCGLLIPCSGYDSGPYFALTCFSQNGVTLYPDTSNSCNTIEAVNNLPNKNNSISVYPNPFSDKLNVSIKENEPSEIILYDLTSRKLLQEKFTKTISLNTSQLSAGLYFYEVRNENGTVAKGKVVKE